MLGRYTPQLVDTMLNVLISLDAAIAVDWDLASAVDAIALGLAIVEATSPRHTRLSALQQVERMAEQLLATGGGVEAFADFESGRWQIVTEAGMRVAHFQPPPEIPRNSVVWAAVAEVRKWRTARARNCRLQVQRPYEPVTHGGV